MNNEPPITTAPSPLRRWSFWAALVGGLALVMVLLQMTGPAVHPNTPEETPIREIAGDITRTAWHAVLGVQSEAAKPPVPQLWERFALFVPIFGVTAILLALVALLNGEPWKFAAFGFGLGVTAVVFQFYWWIVLLVIGVLILIFILHVIGTIAPL